MDFTRKNKIVKIKNLNFYQLESLKNENLMIKEENEILKSMRYEYYIHYFGMDRRNDRWVTE